MVVDRLGMTHAPHGTPGAGQYTRKRRSQDDDVRAWEAKAQIDMLAGMGRIQEARELAQRVGALVPAAGDRIPYGDGSVAIFDDHTLESADIHGPMVEQRSMFDPSTIKA